MEKQGMTCLGLFTTIATFIGMLADSLDILVKISDIYKGESSWSSFWELEKIDGWGVFIMLLWMIFMNLSYFSYIQSKAITRKIFFSGLLTVQAINWFIPYIFVPKNDIYRDVRMISLGQFNSIPENQFLTFVIIFVIISLFSANTLYQLWVAPKVDFD